MDSQLSSDESNDVIDQGPVKSSHFAFLVNGASTPLSNHNSTDSFRGSNKISVPAAVTAGDPSSPGWVNGITDDVRKDTRGREKKRRIPKHHRHPLSHPAGTGGETAANATTLGDIMTTGLTTDITGSPRSSSSSSPSKTMSPLPPSKEESASSTGVDRRNDPQSLAAKYGISHPLDRMALTANGNLQRLVSSYYDAPVSVQVDYCVLSRTVTAATAPAGRLNGQDDPQSDQSSMTVGASCRRGAAVSPPRAFPPPSSAKAAPQPKTWDRLAHLSVFNRTFCTASSVITVYDPLCQRLVESGQVGLGQLFRFLDLLPEFTLHAAAPSDRVAAASSLSPSSSSSTSLASKRTEANDSGGGGGGGGFWREYTLSCAELSCRIREEFAPNMWNLRPLRDQRE